MCAATLHSKSGLVVHSNRQGCGSFPGSDGDIHPAVAVRVFALGTAQAPGRPSPTDKPSQRTPPFLPGSRFFRSSTDNVSTADRSEHSSRNTGRKPRPWFSSALPQARRNTLQRQTGPPLLRRWPTHSPGPASQRPIADRIRPGPQQTPGLQAPGLSVSATPAPTLLDNVPAHVDTIHLLPAPAPPQPRLGWPTRFSTLSVRRIRKTRTSWQTAALAAG